MCKPTSSPPEEWISNKSAEKADFDKRSLDGPFKEQFLTIPDKTRERISGLITEGEDLAAFKDLNRFRDWIEESYEALEAHPVQQQLFNEFCRTSDEQSFIVRTMIGVWLLRLALR